MTRVRVLDTSLPLYPLMPYRTSVYTPACLPHVTPSSMKVAISLVYLFSKYITIYLATLSVGEWTVINGIWVSQRAWKSRKDGARTETGLTFGEGEEPTPAVSTRDSSQHHRPGLSHHPHLCADALGLRARMGKAPPAVPCVASPGIPGRIRQWHTLSSEDVDSAGEFWLVGWGNGTGDA